jgi:protein phosphatase
MQLQIPEISLVVLMGPSGAGKSSFARQHFSPTEVVSSDVCRGLVSDDDNNQDVSPEAFELLHHIVALRLALGRLVVIDATNIWPADRRPYVELARAHHCPLVAITFDLDVDLCHERNQRRTDRTFGRQVVWSQSTALRHSLPTLNDEGFSDIYIFHTPEDVARALIQRTALRLELGQMAGPEIILGDGPGGQL